MCIYAGGGGDGWRHERAYSGADEGAEIIQANYNERALELEALENEARQEYQAALMERGGN